MEKARINGVNGDEYKEGIGKIISIPIEIEMQTAYIDYSMSVIVSRALPDVRDGLKPVQRRILYAMNEMGLFHNRPYKKCARIVGEVLGKYHPHGDTSVYDALVRMAQDWVMRYPLVEGQGNFGSIDGDPPAAMRYTEARLQKISQELLSEIDYDTVDFNPNFDNTLKEPQVLPSLIPNILLNGATGIAVGMATNIPPHNLKEVCDALLAYLNNPNITIEELIQYIKGPDFPTGGLIFGKQGIIKAYLTGKGNIIIRGVAKIEKQKDGKNKIIITQIPYNVNKSELIIKIANLVNEKKIDGIINIEDHSNREGISILIELRKDAVPEIVLNNLYKHTSLQETFNIINLVLVNGKPKLLNLKEIISHYINFRYEILQRKLKHELTKLQEKAHILDGLIKVIKDIDTAIDIIKKSEDVENAKKNLIKEFTLTEIQAKSVLEMRLQRLTSLERENLIKEYEETISKINKNKEILENPSLQTEVIKEEILRIKNQYGDERRTQIIEEEFEELSIEDVVPDAPCLITISANGYIKRLSEKSFRLQGRGGKGVLITQSTDDDYPNLISYATNHQLILFFTSKGACYYRKAYEIPEGTRMTKGRSVQNFFLLRENEKIVACIPLVGSKETAFSDNLYFLLITKKGKAKRILLKSLANAGTRGIKVISLQDNDELIGVHCTDGTSEVIIVGSSGKAIRIKETDFRVMGRNAAGVRAINIKNNESVIASLIVNNNTPYVLTVTSKGFGKITPIGEFRLQKRGGSGIIISKTNEKTGKIVFAGAIFNDDHLLITTKKGKTIRISANQIRQTGRYAAGSKLISLDTDDSISTALVIPSTSNEYKE